MWNVILMIFQCKHVISNLTSFFVAFTLNIYVEIDVNICAFWQIKYVCIGTSYCLKWNTRQQIYIRKIDDHYLEPKKLSMIFIYGKIL